MTEKDKQTEGQNVVSDEQVEEQPEQETEPVYPMICVVKGMNEAEGMYEMGRPLYKPEELEKWFEENPTGYNVFIQLPDPDAVKSILKIIKFEGTPFVVAVQK